MSKKRLGPNKEVIQPVASTWLQTRGPSLNSDAKKELAGIVTDWLYNSPNVAENRLASVTAEWAYQGSKKPDQIQAFYEKYHLAAGPTAKLFKDAYVGSYNELLKIRQEKASPSGNKEAPFLPGRPTKRRVYTGFSRDRIDIEDPN